MPFLPVETKATYFALSEEEFYNRRNGDKKELVRVKAKTYNEFKDKAREMPDEAWKDIEEIFAESSAHYLAGQVGITDLTPAYGSRL